MVVVFPSNAVVRGAYTQAALIDLQPARSTASILDYVDNLLVPVGGVHELRCTYPALEPVLVG